jgi:hypothetical protein
MTATPQPIKLEVTIAGMCLLVLDDPKHLHVLMPATDGTMHVGHGGAPMKVHVSALYADANPIASGGKGKKKHLFDKKELKCAPTSGGSGAPTIDRSKIVSLREAVSTASAKKFLNSGMSKELDSRLSLPSGTTACCYGDSKCWEFGGTHFEMATSVTLKCSVPAETVNGREGITITGPTGGDLFLEPDASRLVLLDIYHVTPDELPGSTVAYPPLTPGQESPHFHAYWEMLGISDAPSPRFVDHRCAGTGATRQLANTCDGPVFKGANPFTCMVVLVP